MSKLLHIENLLLDWINHYITSKTTFVAAITTFVLGDLFFLCLCLNLVLKTQQEDFLVFFVRFFRYYFKTNFKLQL